MAADITTLAGLEAWIIKEARSGGRAIPAAENIRADQYSLTTDFYKDPTTWWRSRFQKGKAPSLPAAITLAPGANLVNYAAQTNLAEFQEVYNTGGNDSAKGRLGNDCLLISFLTGVSETYRKLDDERRYEIADIFRRDPRYLLSLPVFSERGHPQSVFLTQPQRDMVTGADFLDDRIIEGLSNQYGVAILTLEGLKTVQQGMYPIPMPPSTLLYTNPGYTRGIIIYNIGGGHFQSTYRPAGGARDRNTFMFPLEELVDLRDNLVELSPYPAAAQALQRVNVGYPEATEIRVDGETRWTKSRRTKLTPSGLQELGYTLAPNAAAALSKSMAATNTVADARYISLPGQPPVARGFQTLFEAFAEADLENRRNPSDNNRKRALALDRALDAALAARNGVYQNITREDTRRAIDIAVMNEELAVTSLESGGRARFDALIIAGILDLLPNDAQVIRILTDENFLQHDKNLIRRISPTFTAASKSTATTAKPPTTAAAKSASTRPPPAAAAAAARPPPAAAAAADAARMTKENADLQKAIKASLQVNARATMTKANVGLEDATELQRGVFYSQLSSKMNQPKKNAIVATQMAKWHSERDDRRANAIIKIINTKSKDPKNRDTYVMAVRTLSKGPTKELFKKLKEISEYLGEGGNYLETIWNTTYGGGKTRRNRKIQKPRKGHTRTTRHKRR